MLTQQTIDIVKSTAPVLAEEGAAITRLFYSKLFTNHPELQNVFNMSNQVHGDQPQALAQSVWAYAHYIDRLEELGALVQRITQKHASLHVLPEHYPIVGHFLLESVQEHLGLPEGDPILTAWGEAYGVLADLLISVEEGIYQANEAKGGGWRGFREFVIDSIVEEAEGVKSFYLKPKDGGEIPSFTPGQYVGMRVHPKGDVYDSMRQYSLSDTPGKEHYRITVKAEAEHPDFPGKVSNYLHTLSVGSSLELQPPTGEFVLQDTSKELVFIAGGVGITPLNSMLMSQVEAGKSGEQMTFIQCCRSKKHHVWAESMRRLAQDKAFTYYVSYDEGTEADHEGYLTKEIVSTWLPNTNADVYFCGPKAFMDVVDGLLDELGVSKEQRHYELFGPHSELGQ